MTRVPTCSYKYLKKIAYLLKKTFFSISYYANETFVDGCENNNTTWCVLPNWIEKIYANKAKVFDSESFVPSFVLSRSKFIFWIYLVLLCFEQPGPVLCLP